MTSSFLYKAIPTLLGMVVLLAPGLTGAREDVTTIAKTYAIQGEHASGDLVSFDRSTQAFTLARVVGDPNLFGVVVVDPLVVLRTTASGTPVMNTGEARVNVTTINGGIAAGDYVTSSTVPGKGEKSTRSGDTVIGVALEPFPSLNSGVSVREDGPVYSGAINVLLSIGPRPSNTGGTLGAPGIPGRSVTGLNTPVANILKYLLATLVVVGSIYVAFRNFGSNLRDSIISVGRNPLAKPAIQSMVVINTALVIVVTAVGLFIGLMILFVQL
jgi:hypothetical protein